MVVLLWSWMQEFFLLQMLDNLFLMSAPFVSVVAKINKKDH
jgi:hypothetical protein